MGDKHRGKIEAEYVSFCGGCGTGGYLVKYHREGRKGAEKEAREDGWSNTKDRGWLCPKCQKTA